MINPLISRHPDDTLHCIYSVLDFLETLPSETEDGAFLSQTQTFGLFCILECLKGALKFEGDRASTRPPADAPALPPADLVRRFKRINHPALKHRLLSEFGRAVNLCHSPESAS